VLNVYRTPTSPLGLAPAISVLTLELRDTTLKESDLPLGVYAAPAERSRHGELAVELLKLAACGVELGIRRRVHAVELVVRWPTRAV